MKLPGEPQHRPPIARLARGVLLANVVAQAAHELRRDLPGEPAHDRRLDESAGLEHLVHLVGRRPRHESAPVREDGNEPVVRQSGERMPDFGAAHPEHRREPLLDELRPGAKAVLQDRVQDALVDPRHAGFRGAGARAARAARPRSRPSLRIRRHQFRIQTLRGFVHNFPRLYPATALPARRAPAWTAARFPRNGAAVRLDRLDTILSNAGHNVRGPRTRAGTLLARTADVTRRRSLMIRTARFAFAAVALLASAAGAQEKLRIAGNFTPDHSSSIAIQQFKKEVEQATKGKVVIEVF